MFIVVETIVTTLELKKLDFSRCEMHLTDTQWSQVSPCHLYQIVSVEQLALFQYHGWIEIQYFEQHYGTRLEEISQLDIHDEAFIPVCSLFSFHSQVIHLSAHGYVVINDLIIVLHVTVVVAGALFLSYASCV